MKLHEALAGALVQEGVSTIFTLIDDPILAFVQSLLEHGIRIISARHEQAAVGMADGYARSTGGIGVCVIGAGPAVAQTGTALITARRNRTKLLVIAGDTPSAWRHHIKSFGQESFIRATAGSCYAPREVGAAGAALGQALRQIKSGGGPAVLSIASNLLDAALPSPWTYQPETELSHRTFPDPAAIRQAARLLAAAQRPVLLAGGGAVAAGAKPGILRLADAAGALLATTIQARDWFRGDQRAIGIMGAFATEQGRALFAQADLLVAIGTSLNPYIQDTAYGPHGHIAPDAKIIQIDRDPAPIGDYQPVALGITGDAAATVHAIGSALGAAVKPAWAGGAAPALPPPEDDGNLFTAAFLAALDPLLPADRTVVVDCGLFVFPLVDAIHCPPEHFIWTMNFGAVGMALAIGIGAAAGAPQRPCFVFAGDGGFTMAPQEIMTAAANGIPVTVIILDDGAYGAEAHLLKARGKPLGLALLFNPDLAAMARSMGADAVTVRTLADLVGIAPLFARPRERPLVIHAIVERPAGHRAIP